MTPERLEKLEAAKNGITKNISAWCDAYDLSGKELLALCAFITGAALCFQDNTKLTKEQALEIVLRNIEAGNIAGNKTLAQEAKTEG